MARKDIADETMAQYPNHCFVNNDPENYSPDFSWSKCELCDGPAGSRYNVAAVVTGQPDNRQIDFEVCSDCMYYVAYGEGSEDYMGEDDTDLTTFNGRLHNASDVDDKCDGYKSIGG